MYRSFRAWAQVFSLILAVLCAGTAFAQEGADRRIRVAGDLADGVGTSVTIGEIEQIGLHEFTIYNPYELREDNYTGVFISDLVKMFGAEGVQSITLVAIDQYIIEFSQKEWEDYRIVLSTRMNGEYFGFDKKGPVRVVYPDYDASKLEYQETLPKWIWMITRIEFKK